MKIYLLALTDYDEHKIYSAHKTKEGAERKKIKLDRKIADENSDESYYSGSCIETINLED